MAIYYRVALSFARLPDTELEAFANSVVIQMTGNPSFPTPKVSMADLKAGAKRSPPAPTVESPPQPPRTQPARP